MENIPKENEEFKITFPRHFPDSELTAKMISHNNSEDPYRKFKVQILTESYKTVGEMMTDEFLERFAEVELKWFDYEETGRKIEIKK